MNGGIAGLARAGGLPLRAVAGSIGGYWLFFVLLMALQSRLLEPPAMQGPLLVRYALVGSQSALLTFVLWFGLRPLDGRPLAGRIAVAALGCAPTALAFAVLAALAFQDLSACGAAKPTVGTGGAMMALARCRGAFATLVAEHLATGYFLMSTWSALYLALGYAAEVGAWERRAASLRDAARLAELRALRYQVNPHFLFNTLNALSTLVLARRNQAAEEMIAQLSAYYRASLIFDPERDVTLGEEVELQRLYLLIEMRRFPHRLRAQVELAPSLDRALIPAMLLQPLIENAVKHGVARSRSLVTVQILARAEIDRLTLEVVDDARPTDRRSGSGAGVGLRNVQDRLAARYGSQARLRSGPLVEGGFRVTLDLPLVRDGG